MSESTADTSHDLATDEESYSHGYDSFLTLKHHTSRTASVQAKWFLPHLKPDMALLDCGCGSGSITVGLAAAVDPGQVTGIDVSDAEIERAKERAATSGRTNLQFRQGNLYHLDLPSNAFDALFCHKVLEHLNNPGKALQEMKRVLKPGGIIGVRDADWSGALLAPDDALLHRFLEIYEAYWTDMAGSPHLGRQLPGLLAEADFRSIEASASYEVYGDLERRRFASQLMVSRIAEPDFVSSVLQLGLASQEELASISSAWSIWPESPCAFLATANVEVVARKA